MPYRPEHARVAPGSPAELVVLSDGPDFRSFKAVREAYLPGAGLWVADYPFLQRGLYAEVVRGSRGRRKRG